MNKNIRNVIVAVLLVLLAGLYYYIYLPAINIHSAGCWFFVMSFIVIILALYVVRKLYKDKVVVLDKKTFIKSNKVVKSLVILLLALVAIYVIGDVLSSPIINAKKYQQLMTVEERVFTDDIKQADYATIPLLDKDSAELLGDRKMGSMVDMVSQFEVAGDYTQINYQGKPVRVTPLEYASTIKWLTNQSKGIPAYMLIDMATQNTECVKLNSPIKYSKSEMFNRNLYRHLRFNYPTKIFDNQIFFEIDEEGTPYWVCPVKKFNIGLFGGQTVGSVVLCNASTGECVEYDVKDVPTWVDKVYSAELLMQLYDYNGTLKHGYFNSVLGQKDCLQSTNGYNYIALDDDVWVYTGVTSVNGDQSNVGFVLMNQRTMETRYYTIDGAIEDSAMSSAQGQVQNLGYRATFPLLLNIADEPTYFMALKDNAGLVKKYAMVNVQKYQLVSIGDSIRECEKNYRKMLSKNGVASSNGDDLLTAKGKISAIAPIVLDGNTHYYVCLENSDDIFDIDMARTELISIVKYKEGDEIQLGYIVGDEINTVEFIQ